MHAQNELPLVSIIVPVYNAEKTLSRCINSILKQTYANIEILIIDDGSSDKSASIAMELAKKDKRIQYRKKTNGGAASARNLGLSHANGEYIQFADSDDYVDSRITEYLVKAIESNNVDLAISGMVIIGNYFLKKNVFKSGVYKNREEMTKCIAENYEKAFIHSLCNKLYKKKLITRQMNENYIYGEDYIFNIMYLQNVNSFCVIDLALYFYDCTNESITRGKGKNSADVLENQYKFVNNFFAEFSPGCKIEAILANRFLTDLLAMYIHEYNLMRLDFDLIQSIFTKYGYAIKRIDSSVPLLNDLKERKRFKVLMGLKRKRLQYVIRYAIKRLLITMKSAIKKTKRKMD